MLKSIDYKSLYALDLVWILIKMSKKEMFVLPTMSADMPNGCGFSILSEEEAEQVQEKMDALRIRCSVLSLSSLDILQRLEQALEASSRCTSSQEDLHLWLGRIERELLGAAGVHTHAGDAVLCAAEKQRVTFSLHTKTNTSEALEMLLTISMKST